MDFYPSLDIEHGPTLGVFGAGFQEVCLIGRTVPCIFKSLVEERTTPVNIHILMISFPRSVCIHPGLFFFVWGFLSCDFFVENAHVPSNTCP